MGSMRQEQPNSAAARPLERDRLLPLTEVRHSLGELSRTTIWRLGHRDPTFPRPVTIGGRTLWSEKQLDKWIARKLAGSEASR